MAAVLQRHRGSLVKGEVQQMARTMLSAVMAALMLLGLLAGPAAAGASEQACWGQATKVFAQTGVMGQHASEQATPRVGLRNLARALADQGVIEDDSMASLGAFVAAELGLDVAACPAPSG
jgi:hypothetical protein